MDRQYGWFLDYFSKSMPHLLYIHLHWRLYDICNTICKNIIQNLQRKHLHALKITFTLMSTDLLAQRFAILHTKPYPLRGAYFVYENICFNEWLWTKHKYRIRSDVCGHIVIQYVSNGNQQHKLFVHDLTCNMVYLQLYAVSAMTKVKSVY